MRPHYGALRALHAQPTASSHCRSSPTHRICYVATLSHQRDASKTELRDAYALDRALLAEDMKKNRRSETARSNKKIKAIEKMWASVGEAHAELLKKHELREYQLANATRENPHRLGVLAGYGFGRYSAVAGDGIQAHPAAFSELAAADKLPPLPPREECSLPDARMLGITMSEGQAAWPEEAGDE